MNLLTLYNQPIKNSQVRYVVSFKGIELTDPMSKEMAEVYRINLESSISGLEVTEVRW